MTFKYSIANKIDSKRIVSMVKHKIFTSVSRTDQSLLLLLLLLAIVRGHAHRMSILYSFLPICHVIASSGKHAHQNITVEDSQWEVAEKKKDLHFMRVKQISQIQNENLKFGTDNIYSSYEHHYDCCHKYIIWCNFVNGVWTGISVSQTNTIQEP